MLNTLAGVLVDLGGRERLTEAEAFLRRSLALGEKLQVDRHVAQVLNTLAGVLVDLGGRERLTEAEPFLRRSLALEEKLQKIIAVLPRCSTPSPASWYAWEAGSG